MFDFSVSTTSGKQIVDITQQVSLLTERAQISEGGCFLFVNHTTCSLTTADLDPGTDMDFFDFMKSINPHLNYKHPHNPAHAPDHFWSSIIGPSLFVPIHKNSLVLGTWQHIVLVELNGPREIVVFVHFSKT